MSGDVLWDADRLTCCLCTSQPLFVLDGDALHMSSVLLNTSGLSLWESKSTPCHSLAQPNALCCIVAKSLLAQCDSQRQDWGPNLGIVDCTELGLELGALWRMAADAGSAITHAIALAVSPY